MNHKNLSVDQNEIIAIYQSKANKYKTRAETFKVMTEGAFAGGVAITAFKALFEAKEEVFRTGNVISTAVGCALVVVVFKILNIFSKKISKNYKRKRK